MICRVFGIFVRLWVLSLMFGTAFADSDGGLAGTKQSPAVVTYQNKVISIDEFRASFAGLNSEQKRSLKEAPSAAQGVPKDLMVRRELAAQAREQGLDKEPLVLLKVRLADEKVLSDALFERAEAAALSDKKIERIAREEYLAHPERYRVEERRVRHILVREAPSRGDSAREIAEGFLKRLDAGESFEDLARKHSDDPSSAATGGDLGWVSRGRTVKEFEDMVFSLQKPGALSGVFSTQFGYHIVKLDEMKPIALIPYDEIKPKIIEVVKADLRKKARISLVDPILKSESMRVDQDVLDKAMSEIGVN